MRAYRDGLDLEELPLSLADPLVRQYHAEEVAEMRLLDTLGAQGPKGPDGKPTPALGTREWLDALHAPDPPLPTVDPLSPEAAQGQAGAEAMFGGPAA